jgi:predicted membrane chloride channel (bestrophin family)
MHTAIRVFVVSLYFVRLHSLDKFIEDPFGLYQNNCSHFLIERDREIEMNVDVCSGF